MASDTLSLIPTDRHALEDALLDAEAELDRCRRAINATLEELRQWRTRRDLLEARLVQLERMA